MNTPQLTGPQRWAVRTIALLLAATAFVVVPDAKEAFRLPKTLLGGWLGLASLVVGSAALWHVRRVPWSRSLTDTAPRLLLPLLAAALLSTLVSAHPHHTRESTADLAIGVACVIGWAWLLPADALRRLLMLGVWLGTAVAVLLLDQASGVVGLLGGLQVTAPTARLALTSTLGNPGDVGAYLVLPILVALDAWPGTQGGRRGLLAVALVAMAAALVTTATLAALAAVLVGLTVRWWCHGSPGQTLNARLRLVVAVAAVVCLFVVVVPALRARAATVGRALVALDLNTLLTGRLDGWRAAARMWRTHPMLGVGQGAFRAEFADTRLALQAEGVPFFAAQQNVMFATPHNEMLSVAAENGLAGLAALAWAVAAAVSAARRLTARRDAALAWAGLAAVGTLSLAWFPWHAAAVAWPWLLWLAWLCRRADTEGGA